jgi:hypothetical protein
MLERARKRFTKKAKKGFRGWPVARNRRITLTLSSNSCYRTFRRHPRTPQSCAPGTPGYVLPWRNDDVGQRSRATSVALGIRANLNQFLLLILINACVGGMSGLERTVVPLIGSETFHLASTSMITGFIDVMHTPGHTPEHISLLVTDRTRADEPWFVPTGHTLMVGDVGRTELASDAATGALTLFFGLQRLKALPDHIEVLPGAFAGVRVRPPP